MSAQSEVSQRDLRLRSREIMDAIEGGQSFTVTRDGRAIAELVPIGRRQRFVPRAGFAQFSQSAPVIDIDRFQRDQNAVFDAELEDPYAH